MNIKLNFILGIVLLAGMVSCNTEEKQDITQEKNTNNNKLEDSKGIQIDSNRYWKYNGKKVLLLGAFNHGHNPFIDGSTIDTVEVDKMEKIVSQMDEMSSAGGNTLRCVLDPGSGALHGFESYERNKNGLYDLTKPRGSYWDRLTNFISGAEKRDIIVEIEIWDRFDWFGENWKHCPFHPENNINYTNETSGMDSDYERKMIYHNHPMSKSVPGHPAYDTASVERKNKYDIVRKYQEIFVSKVFECASPHKNVLYNMNNETSEPAPWGEYWISFLKKKAKGKGISIICTNMADGVYKVPDDIEFISQLNSPDIYDYLDASQVNSRHRDETHWEKVKWITDQAKEKGFLIYMTKLYGSDDRLPEPWASWKPGDTDNAIEEWWRNLIAGVAGVRFHRPNSGIGLSDKSKACIAATRKIESKIKFWDVEPHMELLSDRDFDEAYLAADPGKKYIIYFTQNGGGSVGLNLVAFNGISYVVNWVNIDNGKWGEQTIIAGGGIRTIKRPDDSAHWVAAIYSE